MKKKIYHDIITCSFENKEKVKAYALAAKMPELTNIKYGLHIVVIVEWLQMKFRFNSSDIAEVMQNDPLKRTTARQVWNIITEATVHSDKTAVLGGNIILPKGDRIKLTEVEKALQLLNPRHRIREYLTDICGQHFSVNYLDYKGLQELVSMIDFPIPSIGALIKSLGYHYVMSSPYADKNIFIGRVECDTNRIWVMYGANKYKLMPFTTFTYLVAQQALELPLTEYEAYQLNICTNHISKE